MRISLQNGTTVLLIALLLLLAAVEGFFVSRGVLLLSDAWFLLFLVLLGALSLTLGGGDRSVAVLGLVLASLSVVMSTIVPEELYSFGPVAGPLLGFLWKGLTWLFPFVFLHFSLIFPVAAEWIQRAPARQAYIYLPYLCLLVLDWIPGAQAPADTLAVLSIPLGLAVGLGVFVRQYLFALSLAEKNRLRLILAGCLAGAVPRILALLTEPGFLEAVSFFLLPLFPLSLVFAVLKEDFSAIGPAFQKVLVLSLVSSGVVTGFFLVSLLMARVGEVEGLRSPGPALLLFFTLALVLFYPLRRWARSYAFALAPTEEGEDSRPHAGGRRFETIQPNPYIAGNPVRDPNMFFGRHEDFEFIRRRLQDLSHGCVIVLHGERRAGKTSILYQVLNGRLGEGFVPVFLDMQGLVVRNDREFLQALAGALYSALEAGARAALGTTPEEVETYLQFGDFLDRMLRAAGERRLVLLIDEYELIDAKVQDGRLDPAVYSFLNSQLERHLRLNLVFTGSQTLGESGRWSVLLGKSLYREVTFLDYRDAADLVRRPLEGKVFFRPGVVGSLLRLTHGHPFYTQAVCQVLVEVVNERQSAVVSRRTLEETVRRLVENPPPQLLYQWAAFSSEEKLVLSALAALLKAPDPLLELDRVVRLLGSLHSSFAVPLDGEQVRMLLETLRRRKVLDRDRTRYRFTMDLLRLWIQSERSLWNVLNEIAVQPSAGLPNAG